MIAGTEHIFKSTDAGETWSAESRPSDVLTRFRTAKWSSTTTAWARNHEYGVDNTLALTTDAGVNWSTISAPYQIVDFTFADRSRGWITTTSGEIVSTKDGGLTWIDAKRLQSAPIPAIHYLGSDIVVAIIPTDTEPLVGFGDLFRSKDGGMSWDTLAFTHLFPGYEMQVRIDHLWIESDRKWRAFADSVRYESSDAGDTWVAQAIRLPDAKKDPLIRSALLELTPLDGSVAWARGLYDEIFRTVDGGLTWSVQDTGSKPTGLIVFPKLAGFTPLLFSRVLKFSSDGLIALSTNGGDTWQDKNPGIASNLMSISFADAQRGMVGSLWGGVYRTSDGGTTWEDASIGQLSSYTKAIDMGSSTTAVAFLSHDSSIYTSSDFGETWIQRPVSGLRNEGGRYFERLQMVTESIGYIVGFKGNIVKTTDGGSSWRVLPPPNNSLMSLHDLSFITTEKGWIVGDSGVVYRTTDGGMSWIYLDAGDEPVENAGNYLAQLYAVSFVDENRGLVAGGRGRVFTTSDGGTTWQKGKGGVPMHDWQFGGFSDLRLFSNGHAWAGIDEGSLSIAALSFSTDYGLTWSKDTILSRFAQTWDLDFPVDNLGFALCGKAMLYRLSAPASSVKVARGNENEYLDLKFAPSPTEDNITCSVYGLYSITDQGSLNVKIYDLLGREVLDVSELARDRNNGKQSQFNFSTRAMSSGAYIARVTTSNGSVAETFRVLR